MLVPWNGEQYSLSPDTSLNCLKHNSSNQNVAEMKWDLLHDKKVSETE